MLHIKDLRKVFNAGSINEMVAIQSLNCFIQRGDFVTIIGSNGAGKSTFLNLIAGTLMPDGGEILLDGEPVTGWPEHRRAGFIGRVFQNPLLGTCGSMTIEENFALAGQRGRKLSLKWGVTREAHKTFHERIRQLGLGLEYRLKDRVGLLSGGQRQSLTLLMATLQKPRLLLLDEHTAALDPPTAEQVLRLTRSLIEEMELSAVMVTHNMQQAIDLGNRLVMMHQGRIILDVAGEEKRKLQVPDLLQEFARLKGEGGASDRMLLI